MSPTPIDPPSVREGLAPSNGVLLCYQTFGVPQNPTVVLIRGAGSQGVLWTDTFCQEIAKAGYSILRFDHRDTGQSSILKHEDPLYTVADLAADVKGLMAALKIDQAHIVGLSMGGFIGQILAAESPDLVLSLTLMGTTLDNRSALSAFQGGVSSESSLPPPDKFLVQTMGIAPPSTVLSEEEKIDHILHTWKAVNGTAVFDEVEYRPLANLVLKRAQDLNASKNHSNAIRNSETNRNTLVRKIKCPVLVLHGSRDAFFPIEHAKATVQAIPQAKLLILEGMGHLTPKAFQPQIITALLQHFKASRDPIGRSA